MTDTLIQPESDLQDPTARHLRREPEPTVVLQDIREALDDGGVTSATSTAKVHFDLRGENTVTFGDDTPITVPATLAGLEAFGSMVSIPDAFLGRLDRDLQEHLLNEMYHRQPGIITVRHKDDGVTEVRDLNDVVIDPRRIIDVAAKVIDDKAPVLAWNLSSKELRLDAITPIDFDRGIGGDRKVGDLTRGGIRIGQNRKQNTSPWVATLLYRLACTNGMEHLDDGLKVDARGKSAEEVIKDFEVIADLAFRRVENLIEAHYDLRSQPVENPERTLVRIGREHDLPTRTITTLVEEAPAAFPNEPTMFDIVNFITNQANQPGMKDGVQRQLQGMAGTLVTEHAARCSHCQARLN